MAPGGHKGVIVPSNRQVESNIPPALASPPDADWSESTSTIYEAGIYKPDKIKHTSHTSQTCLAHSNRRPPSPEVSSGKPATSLDYRAPLTTAGKYPGASRPLRSSVTVADYAASTTSSQSSTAHCSAPLKCPASKHLENPQHRTHQQSHPTTRPAPRAHQKQPKSPQPSSPQQQKASDY